MLQLWRSFNTLLGTGQPAQDLTLHAILLRAVLMFFAILAMLRCCSKRFLAQRNALDTLLGFLLASLLARAINGSERLFETIAAGFTVVILHRLLTWAAFKSHTVGKWLKGDPETVVLNGQLQPEALAHLRLSEEDLKEDLRLKMGSDDLGKVERAQVERNGEVSIRRRPEAGA